MKTGVFAMTDQAYFAAPGVSQSALKQMLRSPAHYKAYLETKSEPTAAMKFGTWFDALVFNEAAFYESAFPLPEDHDGRGKEGKQRVAEAKEKGLEPIKHDDWTALMAMRESLHKHPIARACLAHGHSQQCVFAGWNDIQLKGKVDWLPPVESGCLVDLKTAVDASPKEFSKTIWNLDYHVQAAYYLDLWKWATGEDRKCFVFIAVEKEPPYAVSVFNLSGYAIEEGRKAYTRALMLLKECKASGNWPAYSEDLIEVDLPPWAMKEAA